MSRYQFIRNNGRIVEAIDIDNGWQPYDGEYQDKENEMEWLALSGCMIIYLITLIYLMSTI